MKVHGIMKDGTTACKVKIDEHLEFWCTDNYKSVTCKLCLSNIAKVDADTALQKNLVTKKHCSTTEKFMDKVITVLKYNGVSRVKILELLGMPHSSFVYMRKGKTKISLDKALSVANACEMSLDYLCGRVDENGKIIE